MVMATKILTNNINTISNNKSSLMSGMNPYDVCKISNNMSSLRYTFVENELHVERGNSMECATSENGLKPS